MNETTELLKKAAKLDKISLIVILGYAVAQIVYCLINIKWELVW